MRLQEGSAGCLCATLLVLVAVSSLLPNTAAGSCLQYGHSCWGAHGKRSNLPVAAPSSELQQVPPESLAAPADEAGAPISWETADEPEEYQPGPSQAWQRLRRPSMHRRGPPRAVHRDDDADYEAPPPRWMIQMMRQAASKLD